MLYDLIIGVLGNFLTDFIKKLLRYEVAYIPPEEAEEYVPQPQPPIPARDFKRYARHALNKERREIAVMVVLMFGSLAFFLYETASLSLLRKSPLLLGPPIDLGTTRLSFLIDWVVTKSSFAATWAILWYPLSFWIVQSLTWRIVIFVHYELSDVDRTKVLKIFGACIFLWLVPYTAFTIWVSYPEVGILEAFKSPWVILCGLVFIYLLGSFIFQI